MRDFIFKPDDVKIASDGKTIYRVPIYDESGNPAGYQWRGQPEAQNPDEATPYDTASVLQDSTAALYGLGSDAVVDDVFRATATNGADYVMAVGDTLTTSRSQMSDRWALANGEPYMREYPSSTLPEVQGYMVTYAPTIPSNVDTVNSHFISGGRYIKVETIFSSGTTATGVKVEFFDEITDELLDTKNMSFGTSITVDRSLATGIFSNGTLGVLAGRRYNAGSLFVFDLLTGTYIYRHVNSIPDFDGGVIAETYVYATGYDWSSSRYSHNSGASLVNGDTGSESYEFSSILSFDGLVIFQMGSGGNTLGYETIAGKGPSAYLPSVVSASDYSNPIKHDGALYRAAISSTGTLYLVRYTSVSAGAVVFTKESAVTTGASMFVGLTLADSETGEFHMYAGSVEGYRLFILRELSNLIEMPMGNITTIPPDQTKTKHLTEIKTTILGGTQITPILPTFQPSEVLNTFIKVR